MIYNLNEMFGHHGRQARQNATKVILSLRMVECESVMYHALKVIGHLNELEVLGAEINGETQVDMIIETIHKSFDQFQLNFNMNHKLYTLAELLNELVQVEMVLKLDS